MGPHHDLNYISDNEKYEPVATSSHEIKKLLNIARQDPPTDASVNAASFMLHKINPEEYPDYYQQFQKTIQKFSQIKLISNPEHLKEIFLIARGNNTSDTGLIRPIVTYAASIPAFIQLLNDPNQSELAIAFLLNPNCLAVISQNVIELLLNSLAANPNFLKQIVFYPEHDDIDAYQQVILHLFTNETFRCYLLNGLQEAANYLLGALFTNTLILKLLPAAVSWQLLCHYCQHNPHIDASFLNQFLDPIRTALNAKLSSEQRKISSELTTIPALFMAYDPNIIREHPGLKIPHSSTKPDAKITDINRFKHLSPHAIVEQLIAYQDDPVFNRFLSTNINDVNSVLVNCFILENSQNYLHLVTLLFRHCQLLDDRDGHKKQDEQPLLYTAEKYALANRYGSQFTLACLPTILVKSYGAKTQNSLYQQPDYQQEQQKLLTATLPAMFKLPNFPAVLLKHLLKLQHDLLALTQLVIILKKAGCQFQSLFTNHPVFVQRIFAAEHCLNLIIAIGSDIIPTALARQMPHYADKLFTAACHSTAIAQALANNKQIVMTFIKPLLEPNDPTLTAACNDGAAHFLSQMGQQAIPLLGEFSVDTIKRNHQVIIAAAVRSSAFAGALALTHEPSLQALKVTLLTRKDLKQLQQSTAIELLMFAEQAKPSFIARQHENILRIASLSSAAAQYLWQSDTLKPLVATHSANTPVLSEYKVTISLHINAAQPTKLPLTTLETTNKKILKAMFLQSEPVLLSFAQKLEIIIFQLSIFQDEKFSIAFAKQQDPKIAEFMLAFLTLEDTAIANILIHFSANIHFLNKLKTDQIKLRTHHSQQLLTLKEFYRESPAGSILLTSPSLRPLLENNPASSAQPSIAITEYRQLLFADIQKQVKLTPTKAQRRQQPIANLIVPIPHTPHQSTILKQEWARKDSQQFYCRKSPINNRRQASSPTDDHQSSIAAASGRQTL